MTAPLAHGDVETLLPWYANGALEGKERKQVAAHLETCATCREELKFLGDVRAVLRISAAAEQPAPIARNAGFATLPSELQARVIGAPRNRFRRKRYWMPALAASLLAAAGLGVALTVTWLDAPRFRTATSDTIVAEGHVRVAVAFTPGTELADMNSLLRRHNAVITRGPDSSDRWLLEFPLDSATSRDALLVELQNSAGVASVDLVDTSASR